MTSLFDNEYRELLLNSVSPKYLSSHGYKTYEYLEENIRTIIQTEEDKDSYHLVKSSTFKGINSSFNVWFKGYYDYSNLIPDKLLIGKSIRLNVVDDRNNVIEILNLLFDTSYINNINDTSDLFTYWSNILLTIVNETDLKYSKYMYENTYLFGMKIHDVLDYINLVITYHLFKIIGYPYTRVKESIIFSKLKVTDNDILRWCRYKDIETLQDLNEFVRKVDKNIN